MNEVAVQQQTGVISLSSFDEAMKAAEKMSQSNLVPDTCRGRPENMVIMWEYGRELGISPMEALRSIAVINGRPAVWGDTMLAICERHPKFEDIEESFDEQTMTAKCVIKRGGRTPTERTFSRADGEQAGLYGKNESMYKKYEKRMLQMRARSFALRDAFPDATRGIYTREEMYGVKSFEDVMYETEATVVSDDAGASAKKLLAGDSTKVEKPEQPESPTKVEPAKQETAPVDYDKQLAEIIGDKGNVVNAFLLSKKMIHEGETWESMNDVHKKHCLDNSRSLMENVAKLEAQGNV